jgi:hypothetical protein
MVRTLLRLPIAMACLLGAVLAAPAHAQLADPAADTPAATLLLPYFEVDLENPAGANTLFSINNASATAVMAHVTLWSQMHVPVHSFSVYLTGYDMQTINVRNVLDGGLPRTASAGQDQSDTNSALDGISNKGPLSQDINFASCNGTLPYVTLPQSTVDHIRASLTGQPSALAGNQCASVPDGTRVARGYITVDTTTQCFAGTPRDAGYFAGVISYQNVLWGDVTYINHIGGADAGDSSPLVHVRASNASSIHTNYPADPETETAGKYTFYGRLNGWTAQDRREPLPTVFGTRFVNTAAVGTTLTVWRDAKVNQDYFACGSKPSWYPLGQRGVVAFDEQERPEVTASVPFAPQQPNAGTITAFGAAAQRVRVGGPELPITTVSGWMYLNLNVSPPRSIRCRRRK